MKTLQDWLLWMEQQHPNSIELGLDRINLVANKMDLLPLKAKTIVVAGSNGKGSTVKAIEQITLAHGFTVASYTSPHIIHFNERIQLNACLCSDAELMSAIALVHEHMVDITLTYFEIATLAALYLMQQWQPDVCVLEVGLGGRLDAVNIVDADVSIITTVSLEHQEWLGDSLELIAKEKAGVIRHGQAVIIGDDKMPATVLQQCEQLQAMPMQLGEQYSFEINEVNWSLKTVTQEWHQLIKPALDIDCVANAIVALQQLDIQLDTELLNHVFGQLQLAGRFECLNDRPAIYVDVAHNPQAVARVVSKIKELKVKGKTYCVLGMLREKDISGTLVSLKILVDEWHTVSISETPRGLTAHELAKQINFVASQVCQHDNVQAALQQIWPDLHEDDLLIILGSFYTVAQAKQAFEKAYS